MSRPTPYERFLARELLRDALTAWAQTATVLLLPVVLALATLWLLDSEPWRAAMQGLDRADYHLRGHQ